LEWLINQVIYKFFDVVTTITIIFLEATCAPSPNTKRKKGACAWPSGKNILEIVEKSPQQQFQRQHENKYNCDLMRVAHKVSSYAPHHE
jgi:hypothetical protein